MARVGILIWYAYCLGGLFLSHTNRLGLSLFEIRNITFHSMWSVTKPVGQWTSTSNPTNNNNNNKNATTDACLVVGFSFLLLFTFSIQPESPFCLLFDWRARVEIHEEAFASDIRMCGRRGSRLNQVTCMWKLLFVMLQCGMCLGCWASGRVGFGWMDTYWSWMDLGL